MHCSWSLGIAEELTRYRDKHNAMAVALRHAGPAIVASAGTVARQLVCLLLSSSTRTRGDLGPVGGLGVRGVRFYVFPLPALLVRTPAP